MVGHLRVVSVHILVLIQPVVGALEAVDRIPKHRDQLDGEIAAYSADQERYMQIIQSQAVFRRNL